MPDRCGWLHTNGASTRRNAIPAGTATGVPGPGRSLLLVEGLDAVGVVLPDHGAPQLHRRGDLAGLDGEVAVEYRELLALGDPGVLRVGLVQRSLDLGPDLRMGRQ